MPKTFPYRILFVALLSFCIAICWTYATKHLYDYNQPFAVVLEMSLFPVIGWTLALTTGYAVTAYILKRFSIHRLVLQFAVVILFYFIAVIITETVGYHVFNVHNIGTSQYAGLPLCDCLHAPAWMQFGYFALGPLHWLLAKIIIAASNLWYFSSRSDKIA